MLSPKPNQDTVKPYMQHQFKPESRILVKMPKMTTTSIRVSIIICTYLLLIEIESSTIYMAVPSLQPHENMCS